MDSGDSGDKAPRQLRRSTRQSSVLLSEPTVRGPLKRTRKRLQSQTPEAAVNGSREVENGSEDGESPSKKIRVETEGAEGSSGDENETKMDVQESAEDLEKKEDQEMDTTQESSPGAHQPKTSQGPFGDNNLSCCVMLRECKSIHSLKKDAVRMKTTIVKPTTKEHVSPTKPAAQTTRPPANRHDEPKPKISSMADYRRTMEAKSTAVNHHVPRAYPTSERSFTTRQRVNNIPAQKQPVQLRKQGTKKTPVIKSSSGYSCRGFLWYLWRLVLMVLFCSAVLFAYKTKKMADGGTHPSRAVNSTMFTGQLSLLEAHFSSQRSELWRRLRIHLEKHLETAEPTEPVSLIFTGGPKAERTLRCLAQRLASSYSSALNGSVLHIDGASKAGQDSDEVKLDIDSQLRAAFEGDKPVAVIHRFEELPPGSTLIFYRYCDHENAAYKRVFLLFTVLLPGDEIRVDQSLKEVEEMVQDYVKERLVDSSNQPAFNEMDTDKFGGLWSRVSHLILPVVTEGEVEQNGC